MSSPTLTGKAKFWISSAYDIDRAIADESILSKGTFADFDEWDGYFFVGVATVTIELRDRAVMLNETIKGLAHEAQNIRAEAQQRAMAIETRIQQLLAITNEVAA